MTTILDIVRVVLALPVLVFLLFVPGAVALNALGLRHPAPHLFNGREEWVFSAVAISVLVTGGCGFILAEVGIFYWWSVLLVVALACLAFALVFRVPLNARALLSLLKPPSDYPLRAIDRRIARVQRWTLLVLVLAAMALFARPAEMLRGALDSGVYINAGVALGRTGSIFQRDVLMRRLNDDKGESKELLISQNPDRYVLTRLRAFGFYVYDKQAALVVPQHYFLYPVWIGLMYSLFGIWGALYATPILALLAMLAVYFFARRAFSGGSALVTLGLLIVCPVTIWFARYPVSEVLMCLLAFVSFYAFARMVTLAQERTIEPAPEDGAPEDIIHADSHRRAWGSLWGVVAGLALGQLALARPDFIFYLAPVPFYLLYWRLSRTWRHPYTWFTVTLATLLSIFAVHYFFYSFPYTLDLYHNTIINVRRAWGPLLLAFYMGTILLIIVDRLYPRLRPFWRRGADWFVRYRWVWAGACVALVGIYFAYNYGLAPWLVNERRDRAGRLLAQTVSTTWQSYIGAPVDLGGRYNMLRIGWYLSPPGMLVGILGLLRWIWRRLDASTGLFFGCLLVVSYVFIQETYTDPTYIYTMRRYVPVIIPALLLGVGWACQLLWSRVRPRALGIGLAALVVAGLGGFYLYTGRAIIPHVEEQGAVAQLSDLASKFQPASKSVVLFSNERDEPYVVLTPLQYIFGVESFALARPYPDVNNAVLNDLVTSWRNQGYNVWAVLGANGGKLNLPDYNLKEAGTWTYDVPEFEQLRYQKPTNVSESKLPWGIYSVEPKGAASPPPPTTTIDIGNDDYKYLVAGFYREEQAAGDTSSWRWTGDHAVLRVPWASTGSTYDGGTLKLRLRPESPVQGQAPYRTEPVTVTLTLDDTPIGTVIVPPGSQFTDYTVQVPAGIAKKGTDVGNAPLHIMAPTWQPSAQGIGYDDRILGIQVDAVQVSK